MALVDGLFGVEGLQAHLLHKNRRLEDIERDTPLRVLISVPEGSNKYHV